VHLAGDLGIAAFVRPEEPARFQRAEPHGEQHQCERGQRGAARNRSMLGVENRNFDAAAHRRAPMRAGERPVAEFR
jgi:hypothetical protein